MLSLFLGESSRSFPSVLPLAFTAFGLAILAFGAFGFIVAKYYYRLGNMEKRSLDSLIKGGYGLQGLCFLWYRRLSLLHPHFFP